MQILVPGVFLAIIFAFFSEGLQSVARKGLYRRPRRLFIAPALLSASFCLILVRLHAFSLPLILLILAYTFVPSLCIYLQGPYSGKPRWMDLAVVALLWLPLELAVGARWVPKNVQGLVHMAAYGIAITLALVLLLLFRGMTGMKYNLPRSVRDLVYPALGFLIAAPMLILLGRLIGFIRPFHWPSHLSAASAAGRYLTIFAATALPEEILFRALIQNWLMQKFGSDNRTLLLAAVIFGCAHLNNGPGPLPNWRYMLLATVAGFAFGKVFQKAASVLWSVSLHALVNTVDHVFF